MRTCQWCGVKGDHTTKPRIYYTLCDQLVLCEKCEPRHYRRCGECKAIDLDQMHEEFFDSLYEELEETGR